MGGRMRVLLLEVLLAANPVLVQCYIMLQPPSVTAARSRGYRCSWQPPSVEGRWLEHPDAGRRRHQLLTMTLPTLLERVPGVYHWPPRIIATLLSEYSMLGGPLEWMETGNLCHIFQGVGCPPKNLPDCQKGEILGNIWSVGMFERGSRNEQIKLFPLSHSAPARETPRAATTRLL